MTLIPLHQKGSVVAWAIVDDEDAAYLGQWRWTLNANGYAWRSIMGGRRHVYMHRDLAGAVRGDGMYVDHINRDKLDNRSVNLRIVTPRQSAQNKPAISGRFRGVRWDASRRKWAASGQLDGRQYHLGRYLTEEEAGRVAAEWRREHMPFSEEAIA